MTFESELLAIKIIERMEYKPKEILSTAFFSGKQ